jgi:Tfp pilus assembly pilus retraction ATPase PilT
LDRWLRVLTERGAADLFLVAGFPPALRLNGVVTPLSEDPLESDDIEAAVLPSLHPQALQRYHAAGSADISLRRDGLGRFRVNLHRESGRAAVTVRTLPANRHRWATSGCLHRSSNSHAFITGGSARGRARVGKDDHRGRAGERDQPPRREAHRHD